MLSAFDRHAGRFVTPLSTNSGINLTLRVHTKKTPEELSGAAKALSLHVVPLASLSGQDTAALIFYYNQIPLAEIDDAILQMTQLWRK